LRKYSRGFQILHQRPKTGKESFSGLKGFACLI
jgi:hypothetical protein